MTERRGFNPEQARIPEADREKILVNAARNLSEGGLAPEALKKASEHSDLVEHLRASLPLHKENPTHDLFPALPEAESSEGEYAPGMPSTPPDLAKNLLNDLEMAGVDKDLLENVAKRPLLAIRLAEILNRDALGREAALDRYREGMTNFYKKLWNELLPDKNIEVPPMSPLTPEQHEAFDKYRMLPMYLPKLTEAEYPASFVLPDWERHLHGSSESRRPLGGVWVMIETIRKPNLADPDGYGVGKADPLGRAMSVSNRFSRSWEMLHANRGPLARASQALHAEAILPTVEQWNASANLFLSMNENQEESFPDLGSTDTWEWTESNLSAYRLNVGDSQAGRLTDVNIELPSHDYRDGGFRVLVVLGPRQTSTPGHID